MKAHNKVDLSVIILTFNEAKHIGRAIESVAPLTESIYIVDSGSTDQTVEIAESMGAQVAFNPFVNQAIQFNWALQNLPISSKWIMRLDADEIIEEDLIINIAKSIRTLTTEVVGINLIRKHYFMNRWIKHGGRYPLKMLRIWRYGHGRIEDRWMDEHIVVNDGRTITISGGFADWNLNDLTYFTDKHNKYATREAIELINQRLGLFPRGAALNAKGSSFQASFKRWAKEHIYNHLPFSVSSTLYFLWRYFFQLGFLDGREGLVYHFLQGWWYRFLVGSKLMELERGIAHLTDKQEILVELSRLTGHDLVANATRQQTGKEAAV